MKTKMNTNKTRVLKPRWRRYKNVPEMQERVREHVGEYAPEGEDLMELVLHNPVYRTLLVYRATGLSPFALAAITRQEPTEVWEQIKREGLNIMEYCSTTHLPIVGVYRVWGNVDLLSPEDYEDQWEETSARLEEEDLSSLETMFKLYPLRKCRVGFDPHDGQVHRILKEEETELKNAYTLGLTEAQARAFLL